MRLPTAHTIMTVGELCDDEENQITPRHEVLGQP